jgi:hypothetical protein
MSVMFNRCILSQKKCLQIAIVLWHAGIYSFREMVSKLCVLVSFVGLLTTLCSADTLYDKCSSSGDCGYLPLADGTHSVCAFLWAGCNQLTPCAADNRTCTPLLDAICVTHPRCHLHPVCYPTSLINQNICPPAATSK